MIKETYLMIGPCCYRSDTHKTGGVIVLFENTLEYCKKYKYDLIIVDTNKSNYPNKLIAYISILYSITKNVSKTSHISLHGTAKDYVMIAPYVTFLGKKFKKHVSLRKFAGNFNSIYENASFFKKYIIRKTLQNSSVNFFETRYLVDYFKSFNQATFWFPNVRDKNSFLTNEKYEKNFIFLGSISKEKGVKVLCEASNLLTSDYNIDIYGSLSDDFTIDYFKNYNVQYKGPLASDKVIETMMLYNMLILPSFREGYPGVIIEAFSVGMPVIATKLKGIEEMVTDNSGKLIDPGDPLQLKEAIESVDQEKYRLSRQSAIKQFKNFDSDIQTNLFFERLR